MQYRFSHLALLALALSPIGGSALAQGYVQQAATPDADELAGVMRLLAANPTDVLSIVRAGELTLKLGDPVAAAGFFARAERIDPSNPRIKAGKGSLLVQAGRPGEALLQFGQAEQLRGDVRRFAADRGLAYDLIGEQERAQRDYRLALKDGPADETLRRYALSLGISGKRDEALAQIDALLRRSDRAAWRTRAFILAMTGDSGGAARIATSMMPGGMAQGLQPFFDRLPRLGPADRAFAVHFGEVRATPQRLADARLAPRLPALLPETGRPQQPVVLAAVQQPIKTDRKKDRRRGKRERIDVASAAPPVPLPQPPGYLGQKVAVIATTPVYVQPVPHVVQAAVAPASVVPSTAVPPTAVPPSVSLAANRAAPAMSMSAVPVPRREASLPVRATAETDTKVAVGSSYRAASEAPFRAVPPTTTAHAVVTPHPVVVEPRAEPAPVQVVALAPAASAPTLAVSAAPVASTMPVAGASGVSIAAAPVAASQPAVTTAAPGAGSMPARAPTPPSPTSLSQPVPAVVQLAATSTPVAPPAPIASLTSAAIRPAAAPLAAASATLPPAPGPLRGEDSILAKIIANITVPGSELDVAPAETGVGPAPETAAAPTAPPVTTSSDTVRAMAAQSLPGSAHRAADIHADDKQSAAKAAADRKAADARKLAEAKKLADARKAADAKAAEVKAAEVKAAGAKKLADAKKAEELKRKDPKLLEPARIWVQVAGGANEGDLAKEWTRVKTKAPTAFKGRGGWTTPLRATNRVLTGPFKSDAEARAFVNALSKEGLSGFSFTSEAGQKVSRLGGK